MCLWPSENLALHPPALPGPTAVVGLGSHVLYPEHLETRRLQRPDRGVTSGSGTLHVYLDLLEAVLESLASGCVGGHLGSERRRLARSLEAGTAGGLPRDHVALTIGQRHDRVVERGLDVGLPDGDVLADAATAALGASGSWHLILHCLVLARDLHPLGPLARARVGLRVLAMDR